MSGSDVAVDPTSPYDAETFPNDWKADRTLHEDSRQSVRFCESRIAEYRTFVLACLFGRFEPARRRTKIIDEGAQLVCQTLRTRLAAWTWPTASHAGRHGRLACRSQLICDLVHKGGSRLGPVRTDADRG